MANSSNDTKNRKIKVSKAWYYVFLKRSFDIISASLLLIIVSIPLLVFCTIKALEDYFTPYWKLIIKEADANTKKRHSYWNKDGKKYDIQLVPDDEKNKTRKHKLINPVYKSQRVGVNGKIFTFYKLRSMCHHADEMKQVLIDNGFNEADYPMFKMTYDPRITRLGRLIRKTSIDELPQLINIIKGDMSVIGPRSPLPQEYEHFSDYQKQKCLVRGGLICTWQLSHNRNDITFEEWIEMDLDYIEHRSIRLDIKILLKAVAFIFFDHSGR